MGTTARVKVGIGCWLRVYTRLETIDSTTYMVSQLEAPLFVSLEALRGLAPVCVRLLYR